MTIDQAVDHCASTYPVPIWCGKRIAVDIGANIGGFSLAHANRFEHILAIEPCTETFIELVQNTRHLPNVHCLNLAICNLPGIDISLCRHKDHPVNSACHSTRLHDDWQEEIEKALTIDLFGVLSLCDGSIDYMKLDCEGAEYGFLAEIGPAPSAPPIGYIAVEIHAQWPKEREVLWRNLSRWYDVLARKVIDPHENVIWKRKC